MDEFLRSGAVDGVIAELAARQHGLVARRQLLALGIGRGAIDSRILRRRLHPVHRGVYALTPAPLERLARWMAAVLAGGERAVLSHWSAASLWRLRPGVGPRSHVTSPRSRRSNRAITFHHAELRARRGHRRAGHSGHHAGEDAARSRVPPDRPRPRSHGRSGANPRRRHRGVARASRREARRAEAQAHRRDASADDAQRSRGSTAS